MPGGIHPPLSVITSWPMPSPNPERRGWDVFVLMIVLFVLTTIVVGLRLRARLWLHRNAGLDDVFIILAMVSLIPLAVIIAGATRFWGFDKHVWDLTPDQLVLTRKVAMAIEAIYLINSAFTRVSILLFYRRMSVGSLSPVFHWMVRIAIAFVVLSTIAYELALFLSCRPLNAFWMEVNIFWVVAHTEGVDFVCFNEGADLLSATAMSILQDFIACFMPLVLFWTLKMPKRQKVALATIFFVGFLTCICGLFRFYYIYTLFYTSYDVPWEANRAWLWIGVESHLAIICASAPALKAYFRKYFSMSQLTYPLSSWRSQTRQTRPPTTGFTDGMRTSDEKSVVPHGETFFDDSVEETMVSPKGNRGSIHSLREIDLENLNGIAVTCDIEVASEHAYPSLPSSPLSLREMNLDPSLAHNSYSRTPSRNGYANAQIQCAVPPWADNGIPSPRSPRSPRLPPPPQRNLDWRFQ